MKKKIAILGKGGSGKSSMSWLLSQYLSQDKEVQTLAIDGDHNMDLTSCLEVDTEEVRYLKEFTEPFRKLIDVKPGNRWSSYLHNKPIVFQYPGDTNLTPYVHSVAHNLDLMVVGLGDENLMYQNKCSHSYCAALKYLLPTLELSSNTAIVMDSVAGADMVNYGLYFAFDALCVVVEGHRNSIKVAKQLLKLTSQQGLPLHMILNKYNPANTLIQEFETEHQDQIIAKIPIDPAIIEYTYSKVSAESKSALEQLYTKIDALPQKQDSLLALKSFEMQKV